MTINYETIGLKCGLEIHQQLEGRKLFCNCLTKLRDEEPDIKISRKLRVSAGESGKIDAAVLAEIKKGKHFSYQGYSDSTCLVELDEMPPLDINAEALHAVFQVIKSVKAEVPDYIQAMRKTVVDGSNTSGFQRTTLIGRNGILTVDGKKITIPTIALEEDAGRIIHEDAKNTTYRLDRLGIPLIEIATGPEIRSPEECKRVALALGLLLRGTGKCKRGLGTIRQDINVSIEAGNRVEIKGAQDLSSIPSIVENEALRQINLVNLALELQEIKPKFDSPIIDLTEHFKKTECEVIKKAISKEGKVLGCKLSGLNGLLGKEIQPNRRVGSELSDYAKIAAGVKGLFHSDELPKYGVSESEKGQVLTALECGANDAFIIVSAQSEQAVKAIDAAIMRARLCMDGVPSEVRKANPDATTSYLRPMPGASRMYPETDIPLMMIDRKALQKIPVPESITEKINRFILMKLSKDLAENISMSDNSDLFEELCKTYTSLKPAYIAEILVGAAKTIKRDFDIEINPTDNDYKDLFKAISIGEISKESVIDILKENKPVIKIISRYALMPPIELDEKLREIISLHQGKQTSVLMGIAMKELRGKAAGEAIARRLRELTAD